MSMSSLPPEIIANILVRLPVKSLMPCMCVSKQWYSFIVHPYQKILVRLPVKSLMRFMCVSKQWYSFIVDPYFINRHHYHSMKTKSDLNLITEIITLNNEHDLSFLTVPFGDDDEFDLASNTPMPPLWPDRILGCSYGLVCVRSPPLEIALWNPSIGKYKRVPHEPIDYPRIRHYPFWDFRYAHDYFFGFGYEPVHDDYKLLRVVMFPGVRVLPEVKVYSFRLNSWTRVQGWPCGENFKTDKYSSSVVFEGALHFFIIRVMDQRSVLAFNLKTEEFTLYPVPIQCEDSRISLEVLRGCLCIWRNILMTRHEIWMMQQYGVNESWVKCYSIENGTIVRSPGKPIMISKDGKKILWSDSYCFYWYDTESQREEEVELYGSTPVEVHGFCETLLCVGSLLLLNSDTVAEENQENQNRRGG